jgi:hypothetical protein
LTFAVARADRRRFATVDTSPGTQLRVVVVVERTVLDIVFVAGVDVTVVVVVDGLVVTVLVPVLHFEVTVEPGKTVTSTSVSVAVVAISKSVICETEAGREAHTRRRVDRCSN